jgi:hypothetical protein
MEDIHDDILGINGCVFLSLPQLYCDYAVRTMTSG